MCKTGISGKVKYAGAVICIVLVFQSTWASAGEESTGYSILKFGGGLVSAFLIHEAAHEVVGLATGTDMSWKAGDVNQPLAFKEQCSSKAAGLAINSSGMIVQAVGAEFILQYDKIDKNDSFVRGMMLWNIVNPITYAIDYWFIHRTNATSGTTYQGDLQGIEHYSDRATANIFTATMLAVAAFQGYRYARTQTWAPDWLKQKEFDNIGLAPLPEGGAILSYTLEF